MTGNRVYVFKEFSEESKALAARLKFPLKPGHYVFRPLHHNPVFTVNDRKQYVITAQKHGEIYVAASSGRSGIRLFCSSEIREDWQYFVVTEIGRKGRCAFVKPGY